MEKIEYLLYFAISRNAFTRKRRNYESKRTTRQGKRRM